MGKKKSFTGLVFILLHLYASAGTFTVTSTNDSGPGSLRQAVLDCHADPGGLPHSIIFRIPLSDPGFEIATGVWTIVFADEGLPPLSSGYVTIDGSTQADFAGNTNIFGPEICLNGNHNTVECCISIQNSSFNIIKGLIINEFLYGIQIYGNAAHHNIIEGNYLGCNYNGSIRAGNYNAIELISGANNNQVGGRRAEQKNLISGNEYAGIRISDANSNIVINNWVGVNRAGEAALHNYDGITMEGTSWGNVIGGDSASERNVTSGNIAYGIDVFGLGCEGNIIRGNFIGTDVTGSYAIPNTYGILFDDRSHNNIAGGYNSGEGNLISGNTAFGAYFYNNGTHSNLLIGNKIGTDVSGTYAIPNETGVHIDGASYSNMIDSNLISGNWANGITLFATYTDNNLIIRNKIGTDLSGAGPLGNGMHGILITQGAADNVIGGSPLHANIIAHNGQNGVMIEADHSLHNLASCNSIYNNGFMGIELYPQEGANTNDLGDGDSGPNNLLNYPLITESTFLGNHIDLSGVIDVPDPATTRIEIYKASLNNHYIAEGKEYIGTTMSSASGTWLFGFDVADTADYYVVLAIDSSGNTSEFSPEYPGQPDYYSVNDNFPENDIFIYNNWSEPWVHVVSRSGKVDFKKLMIFDMSGRIMKVCEIEDICNEVVIQVKGFCTGKYLMVFSGREKWLVKSFIITG